MELRLYNTLTRKIEVFKPLKDNIVTLYTCGPTVYDFAHIGNFATFTRQDLLKRVLEYIGYKVIHVMNVTDVDDKTIRRAKEEGKSLKEVTEFFTNAFIEDMKALNIKMPTKLVPATSEISEMIKVISALIEKGYAYVRDGSVYFSISKFKDYGKLSKIDVSSLKPGARVDVDEYNKENPADFALWKKSTEEEIELGVYWDSPWGKGRPGWHIECSVIALKHLGETIDIHSGGIDLIFPHHENEIAQSEAYTGKQFARFWVHCEHILVDGKKMSKSLGNYYTLRDIISMGYDPLALRLLFLSCHYRRQLNFTFDALKQAEKNLEYIRNTIRKMREVREEKDDREVLELVERFKRSFLSRVLNDLDMPSALAELYTFLRKVNSCNVGVHGARAVINALLDLDRILGLRLEEVLHEEIPEEVIKMLEERKRLRKEKRYKEADEIRERVRAMGFEVEDVGEDYRVYRKAFTQ